MIQIFLLFLSLFAADPAQAQCNGQFGAFNLCGNLSNTTSAPIQTPVSGNTSSVLSVSPGITAGCVQIDSNGNATSTGANCGNAGATAPGGSNTQVQFNSSGSFAADASFTFTTGSGLVLTKEATINRSGGSFPTSLNVLAVPTINVVNDGGAGDVGIQMAVAGGNNVLSFARANNSLLAPTATPSGGQIGRIAILGTDTTQWQENANVTFSATQTWTTSAHGTQITIRTTPNGSTTNTLALTIGQDQSLTIAGAATVNSQLTAVATNNTIALALSGNTTILADNGYGILHTDAASHSLQSDANAAVQPSFIIENTASGTIPNTSLNVNSYGTDIPNGGFFTIGSNPGVQIFSIGTHGGNNPRVTMAQAENAGSFVPGPTLQNAWLGQVHGQGYDGTNWILGVLLGLQASQNWSVGHNGADFVVQVVPKDSASTVNALTVGSDVGLNSLYEVTAPTANLTSAAPTVVSGIGYGGTTAVSANCGSLAGAAACVVINVGGVTHYVPYY